VEFATRDIDADGLEAIEAEFDAVFLGVGLGAMHKLAVEGGSEAGVVDALEFIARYKTAYIGETEKNLDRAVEALKVGRRVVVIGAGNTAIDAAVAAKRLGAEIVTIVYRRQREAISAFYFEYDHALLEGVKFMWGALPVAVKSGADGLTLECVGVALDAKGLLAPVAGSEFGIECDVVIPAIGQSPLVELLSQVRGVAMERGRVVIDRATGQTTNAKYFAGGDCVNGGREVVDAVADGKRAALGIAAALNSCAEVQCG
jgi:dihydropyrimidine dehydrogenase (NAD+) subunit PreT